MQKAINPLQERRLKWRSKRTLRTLYRKWYCGIGDSLREGVTLELGGGSGNLKEYFPEVISSDLLFAPWLDAVLDAHKLPFENSSLDNIVLFDVLHHLAAPAIFLNEASRVLKGAGRIIMIEPYVSWFSFLVYQFLYAEDLNWHFNPFASDGAGSKKDPFYGNQAIPNLIFEKYRNRFKEKFPQFDIIREEKMDFIVYPLSGGFRYPNLCPRSLYPLLARLEERIRPLKQIFAFRSFIILEKNVVDET